MSERRIDSSGRDVTDLPGLWSDDDKRMSEQIEPGDGWRLIDKEKDTPWEGDQCFIKAGEWADRVKWYAPFHPTLPYRRRMPDQPEAMEIDHQTITCNSFDEVMAKDDSGEVWRVVSNTEQARQLADWLNRYADWREAQGYSE
jgi:hypothetical protein